VNWTLLVCVPDADSMTLTGVYVPLITPFDATGAVALTALEALAHEVLDAGASGRWAPPRNRHR